MKLRIATTAAVGVAVTVLAACGGSAKNSASSSPPPPAAPPSSPTPSSQPTSPPPSSPSGPGALQGEAKSAATGDIPDNQVFLTFTDGAARYSMKYPEGWAQSGGGSTVTIRDKNNIVRIVIRPGVAPSTASVAKEVQALAGATVTQPPQTMTISGAPAVKVVYTTQSAPNAVTGKRVTLTVDRYYLAHGGKQAIVDLGTPVGVDNVDAYRLMIESFRWR